MGLIEPAITLTRHRLTVADYQRMGEVGLLQPESRTELSDTTLRFGREIKLPLYAAAGVPEVWIVDLASQLLRCHRRPVAGEYAEVQVLTQVDQLAVPGLAGAMVDLSGLLA